MRKTVTAIILAVGLQGCGDGGAPTATTANETANLGEVQNRLEEMPEELRNGVFIRAIRDANQECQHVESSQRAGEHEGYPVWTAQCQGGGSFTIVVTEGGSAQVLNDAEVRLPAGNEAAGE